MRGQKVDSLRGFPVTSGKCLHLLIAAVFFCLATPWVEAASYTNTYSGGLPTVYAISNFTNKTYLGSSRLYNQLYTSSINNAGQYFFNDYPIYYQDISKGITDRHRALGFMDIMICVMIDPIVNSAGVLNPWHIYGDADNRSDLDIRAVDGDNTIWDMIDTNYKPSFRKAAVFTSASASVWLSSTNHTVNNFTTANAYYPKSGEFVIARFGMPSVASGDYSLFLGRNVVRPGLNGAEATQTANSYQIFLYTPSITNVLIPVVYVQTPSMDGVWEYTYDYVARIRTPPVKHIRVVRGTPVTFSAGKSYNATSSAISTYEWDVNGSGAFTTGNSNISTSYLANGTYPVKVRLTTASGVQAVNDGLSMDSNYISQTPSLNPIALPLMVEVVDAPQSNFMARPRPSPFIIGVSSEMWIDFNLYGETPVTLSIYTLNGNLIKNLEANRTYPAGFWGLSWDGKDTNKNYVGEGIYYAVLSTKSGKDIKKIHVVRY
ncbi:MAG: PKD domain-containing protein [Spirochaetia bacterium]|nr:PKD domain-containing protein [Spirochaetia bacterium]